MIEKYYENKSKYKDYLIFIKSGIFYETFNNDSFIMNKLFNYKIIKYKNMFKVGFPISNINNIINKLNEYNINYILIEDNIVKKEFNNNLYNNYYYDIDIINNCYCKINNIYNKLCDNLLNKNIYNIINEMDNILCKIDY